MFMKHRCSRARLHISPRQHGAWLLFRNVMYFWGATLLSDFGTDANGAPFCGLPEYDMMSPVLHVITSDARGGLEMYVANLVREQAARARANAGPPVACYALPGTLVYEQLASAGVRLFDARRQSHFSLVDILRIRRIAKREGFGIVHSHTRFDVWAVSLALLGTASAHASIGHVHSTYMVASPKRDPHHRLIYSRVDAVLSSSEHTNRELARFLPVAKEKLHLVRYGRDLGRYVRSEEARAKMRRELGIADDEIAFGTIGRIEPGKGVREFAESLLHLPEDIRQRVKYFVIGARNETNVEAYNESLVEFQKQLEHAPTLRDRLTILPWTTDPVPYLNALDGLVLASYCEMYSLSVIEAMAMSLPVIGTNCGGTPEQIGNNERGLIVEPRSSQSIASAVERYVREPELMRQHGAAGHAWAQREHSMAHSLDALEAVYAEVLAKRQCAALPADAIAPHAAVAVK